MTHTLATLANHQVRLAARPEGLPKAGDWQHTSEAVNEPMAPDSSSTEAEMQSSTSISLTRVATRPNSDLSGWACLHIHSRLTRHRQNCPITSRPK